MPCRCIRKDEEWCTFDCEGSKLVTDHKVDLLGQVDLGTASSDDLIAVCPEAVGPRQPARKVGETRRLDAVDLACAAPQRGHAEQSRACAEVEDGRAIGAERTEGLLIRRKPNLIAEVMAVFGQ